MDKERFSTLLQNPSQVTNADIKALNEYRKKYPYFQSLYVVVAKALKDREHPKTEAFIKKAAIYSANRAHLKEIIEGDFVFEQKASAPKQETGQKPVVKPEPRPETVESKTTEIPENPENETAIEQPEKAKDKKKTQEVEGEKTAKTESKEKLEKQEKKEVREAEIKKVEHKAPITQGIPAQNGDHTQKAEAKGARPNTQESKISADLAEIEAAKRRIEALLSGQLNEEAENEKKPLSEKKRNQIEIIEKFIKNEPQIDRERMAELEGKVEIEDLADKSILTEEAFETETLAKLMAQQGKLNKAEDIYKKLSLKFPEKSTYFATQIQKLKSK